jgi:hypothetical protein
MTDCPSTHTIDTGDWAEPEHCELPIEHNVDGSWHQAGWKGDDEELLVRWAPEIGETCHWPRPPYVGPSPELVKRMVAEILDPLHVWDKLPVRADTGSTVAFRKWAPIQPPDYSKIAEVDWGVGED